MCCLAYQTVYKVPTMNAHEVDPNIDRHDEYRNGNRNRTRTRKGGANISTSVLDVHAYMQITNA